MKKIIQLLFITLLMFSHVAVIHGEEGTITYQGDEENFVYDPATGKPLDNLFPDFENVMPGDSITTSIKVKSTSSKDSETRIYLMCLGPENEDYAEVFEKLTLTVKLNKDSKKIYEGPVEDTVNLSDWVLLGTFNGKGEVTLDITLTVPIECGNEVAGALTTIDWVFKAEVEEDQIKTDDDDDNPFDAPDTGDLLFRISCGAMAASATGIILLLIIKKKNKDDED